MINDKEIEAAVKAAIGDLLTQLRMADSWLETAEKQRSFGADPGTALAHALDDVRAAIGKLQGPSLNRRGIVAVTPTDGAA